MTYNWDCMIIGLTHLKEDSFFDENNKQYFQTMQKLLKQNIKPDINAIETEYRKNGKIIPESFKLPKDSTIDDCKIKTEILKNYCQIRKIRNEMLENMDKIDVWNYKTIGMNIASKISSYINFSENEIVEEWEVKNTLLNQIKNGSKRKIIKTGYYRLDDKLEGFGESNLITIAARTAMGKTAFAGQLAINNKNRGHKVGFISLEMSNEEIYERILSNELSIPYGQIRSRTIENLEQYKKDIIENIIFVKNQNIKIDQLEPIIEIMVSIQNCEIIYIDHLEKLYDHDSYAKKHERLGYIMDRLKTIAQKTKIPIVIMQQIRREAEENKQCKPLLSDIKSSGSIEEWSDIVLLLHRPEYYDKLNNDLKGRFEVNVAKNRFGDTGTIELYFDAEFMRFRNEY